MSDNRGVTPPPASPTSLNIEPAADALRELGDRAMRRRQWTEAAEAFAKLPGEDAAAQIKRRLSNNLAALQRHRPDVYDTLVRLPAQGEYAVASTASGKPTVTRRADGGVLSLSSGNDPLAAAAAAKQQLYAATKAGEAIGVCGVGDGYLAQVLAHNPPALFMDKQQPVFIIEPEPQVLLQCLMIHDYAGHGGPIEQGRFQWFVGTGWDERLASTLTSDLFLPAPSVMVGQGFDGQSIQRRLREILQNLVELDGALAAEVERYYASGPRDDTGGRPRVLLLTTRFSTVLQYSTRDTAAAFERMGWDAQVVIEPTPRHRVLRTAIRGALADFRPDLVFQIDHLRHEHNGLFPAALPFACWIQDHLPHLATPEAGANVGETDFVLTDATATYVDKFGYPRRQCIALPKLTSRVEGGRTKDEGRTDRTPALHPSSFMLHPWPDDLVFVSNASQTPEAMMDHALATYGQTEQTRELITQCCGRMTGVYESGDALPTYSSVCAVLRQTLADLRLALPPEGFDVLARWLTHPFNDALYRQQALGWAAAAAKGLGLNLALCGKGWESHPRFAAFARGPVAYGAALADVTRRSRINLQIVPYLCLHQRLLDGLMAGGFFLVRTHPADVAPAALLDFVEEHCDRSARTTTALAASLAPHLRETFQLLLASCRPCLSTTGAEDLVAMVRDWQDAGQLVSGEGPLPLLKETSFHDADSLRRRVKQFIDAPVLRESIGAVQRHSVSRRLTYDAGIRRVVAAMKQLLSDPASPVVSMPAWRSAQEVGARAA